MIDIVGAIGWLVGLGWVGLGWVGLVGWLVQRSTLPLASPVLLL